MLFLHTNEEILTQTKLLCKF